MSGVVISKMGLSARRRPVILFMAAVVLIVLLAACTTTTSTSFRRVPSSSNVPVSPILTESHAIETASRKAARSGIGLTGVSDIRNQRARLMTMGEYWALGQYDEGIFGSARWYPESTLPVWVVLLEGNSESTLPPSSPLKPTRYNHFVVVLNAHTGYEIGFSPLSASDQLLTEAQGLDPAFYARYPMEAALEYIRGSIDFPVSEPNSLPAGFSLARVTLELAHPLQDALPSPKEPRQTALQHYSDGQGNTIQLAQFSGELPGLIEVADLVAVQNTKAWASQAGDSTWLAWTWVFPEDDAYVTNILYSVDSSISLATIHDIAASMPGGQPPPPTPEPVMAPTASPTLTPTPAPSSPGVRTPEDYQNQYNRWPEEYKFAIDNEVSVRFAYPSSIIDWAGFAFISHIPSASTVVLGRQYSFLAGQETGEDLWGEEIFIRKHYESDEGETRLESVLGDEMLMRRILSGPGE